MGAIFGKTPKPKKVEPNQKDLAKAKQAEIDAAAEARRRAAGMSGRSRTVFPGTGYLGAILGNRSNIF